MKVIPNHNFSKVVCNRLRCPIDRSLYTCLIIVCPVFIIRCTIKHIYIQLIFQNHWHTEEDMINYKIDTILIYTATRSDCYRLNENQYMSEYPANLCVKYYGSEMVYIIALCLYCEEAEALQIVLQRGEPVTNHRNLRTQFLYF